jgi:hypothetical protein
MPDQIKNPETPSPCSSKPSPTPAEEEQMQHTANKAAEKALKREQSYDQKGSNSIFTK